MKIYPSCSMCVNYEPNSSSCSLLQINVSGMDQVHPKECKSNKMFIRDINVLPESYHLYLENEVIPMHKEDLSKLPIDEEGVPLFVFTKRGKERAIPAYPSVQLKGDYLTGVKKATTYQGQRELIHDLGVELAREEAKARGIDLLVLPGEENSVGIEDEIQRVMAYKHAKRKSPASFWKSDNGGW